MDAPNATTEFELRCERLLDAIRSQLKRMMAMHAAVIIAVGVLAYAAVTHGLPVQSAAPSVAPSVATAPSGPVDAPADAKKELAILLGKQSAYGPRIEPKVKPRSKSRAAPDARFVADLAQLSRLLERGALCLDANQAQLDRADDYIHAHIAQVSYENKLAWNRIVNALGRCGT